jgi:hypothetical protein
MKYKKSNLELRMYGLVNYQLTGIQKGIQFLHGVVEYSQMVNRIGGESLTLYNDWANNHKTVILLNGGTTNHRLNSENGLPFGTLNNYALKLSENGIEFSTFNEPDLGDQLTSVAFIVDERVFNKKDYPNFEDWLVENHKDYSDIKGTSYQISESVINSKSEYDIKIYKEWIDLVGGEKNIFLRGFLKNFKLA